MKLAGKKVTDMSTEVSIKDEAVQIILDKPREEERSHVQDCF